MSPRAISRSPFSNRTNSATAGGFGAAGVRGWRRWGNRGVRRLRTVGSGSGGKACPGRRLRGNRFGSGHGRRRLRRYGCGRLRQCGLRRAGFGSAYRFGFGSGDGRRRLSRCRRLQRRDFRRRSGQWRFCGRRLRLWPASSAAGPEAPGRGGVSDGGSGIGASGVVPAPAAITLQWPAREVPAQARVRGRLLRPRVRLSGAASAIGSDIGSSDGAGVTGGAPDLHGRAPEDRCRVRLASSRTRLGLGIDHRRADDERTRQWRSALSGIVRNRRR